MNKNLDLSSIMALASAQGLSNEDLKELKRQFLTSSRSATKKYIPRAERKTKRKAQKAARRRNRHS